MEWKCARCTLRNNGNREVCEVCDAPRPSASFPPTAMHLKIDQEDNDGDHSPRHQPRLSHSKSFSKPEKSPAHTPGGNSKKLAAKMCLFDHFVVVNLASSSTANANNNNNNSGGSSLAAFITHKFSAPQAPPISPVVTSFCFPDSDQLGLFPNDKAFPSEGFTFVLTEAEGDRVFGFCRRFMFVGGTPRFPGCLCFLSRLPCFALFQELLEHMEARWKVSPGAVFPLLANILAQDVPRPGMLFRISMHTSESTTETKQLSFSSSSATTSALMLSEPLVFIRNDAGSSSHLSPLFRYLSIDNVMLLFSAVLCEKRVLICGSSLEAISECVHAASTMIFPLQWQHIFIPLLPFSLLRYTCAPMPFIIGLRSDHISSVLDLPLQEVIVVSLDKDQISTAGHNSSGNSQTNKGEEVFSFPLPEEITTKLKKILKDNMKDNDGLSDGFLAFFVILFSQARFGEYLLDKSRFDTDRFLSVLMTKNTQIASFMRVLRHSQMFEQFCRQQVAKAGQMDSALPVSSAEVRFDRYCLEVEYTAEKAFKFGAVFKRIKSDRGAMATVATAGGRANPEDDILKACLDLTSNQAPKRDAKDLKRELTVASFDSRFCLKVLEGIWTRMKDSKKKNWRHGYKSLCLLEHLMIQGSDRVVFRASVRSAQDRIEKMSQYSGASEREGDEKVQTAASRVLSLLRNIFHLREVRKYSKITDPSRYALDLQPADQKTISVDREFLHTYQNRSLAERISVAIPSFISLHERHKSIYDSISQSRQLVPPPPQANPHNSPKPAIVQAPPPALGSSASSRALLADLLGLEDKTPKHNVASQQQVLGQSIGISVGQSLSKPSVAAPASSRAPLQAGPAPIAASATSKALLADLLDVSEASQNKKPSALSPTGGGDVWAAFDNFPGVQKEKERKKPQTEDLMDFFCK